MCDTCGCNVTPGNRHLLEPEGKLYRAPDGRVAVHVLQGLLSENDRLAAHNRAHFDSHGVLAVNLMSSPGAGKTALLEATISALSGEMRIAGLRIVTSGKALPAIDHAIIACVARDRDARLLPNTSRSMPLIFV